MPRLSFALPLKSRTALISQNEHIHSYISWDDKFHLFRSKYNIVYLFNSASVVRSVRHMNMQIHFTCICLSSKFVEFGNASTFSRTSYCKWISIFLFVESNIRSRQSFPCCTGGTGRFLSETSNPIKSENFHFIYSTDLKLCMSNISIFSFWPLTQCLACRAMHGARQYQATGNFHSSPFVRSCFAPICERVQCGYVLWWWRWARVRRRHYHFSNRTIFLSTKHILTILLRKCIVHAYPIWFSPPAHPQHPPRQPHPAHLFGIQIFQKTPMLHFRIKWKPIRNGPDKIRYICIIA